MADWAAYAKHRDIFKSNLAICLKRQVYNSYVLPAMVYGAETWTLTKQAQNKLAAAQTKMERSMLNITYKDRKTNIWVRERTKVIDIIHTVRKMKWSWAGHINRLKDDRWTSRVTNWRPYDKKRWQGRPAKRWRDDLDKYWSDTIWQRKAQDRVMWRRHATGSMTDAAMLISIKKSKAMHVHKPVRVDATTEADVATLGLSHKCDSCGREFTKQRGLRVHVARWCDGGRTQRSRLGTLTDKAVKTAKRRVAESALDKVYVGNEALDNVLHFEYLGSQLQGDGEDEADVRHRMDIAQAAFGSLSHLWSDHGLSRATKLRLYRVSVCSTLTHSCEAWTLTRTVVRMINGFNSRCLHAITGEDYRTTATVPVYNMVLAVRKRRLRYLGHVLRLPAEIIVRRSLLALVKGGAQYPEGSLFSDCEAALPQLEALSLDRSAWRDKVSSLTWTVTFNMWFCLNVVS